MSARPFSNLDEMLRATGAKQTADDWMREAERFAWAPDPLDRIARVRMSKETFERLKERVPTVLGTFTIEMAGLPVSIDDSVPLDGFSIDRVRDLPPEERP